MPIVLNGRTPTVIITAYNDTTPAVKGNDHSRFKRPHRNQNAHSLKRRTPTVIITAYNDTTPAEKGNDHSRFKRPHRNQNAHSLKRKTPLPGQQAVI
jgi:hypothetical protein